MYHFGGVVFWNVTTLYYKLFGFEPAFPCEFFLCDYHPPYG